MDLSRAVYSRDLKIAAMRALDAGSYHKQRCEHRKRGLATAHAGLM
jgi:hypothetical protein